MRLAVPILRHVFAPSTRLSVDRQAGAARRGRGGFLPDPDRLVGSETTGSPGFLGSPHVRRLCDPGGAGRVRPTRRAGAAFRLTQGVGPRHIIDFGAQSHGPHTRCLPERPGAARRFAGRVAPPPRKTRFRLWATLCRTGLVTRWTPQKVSAVCSTWRPPSPGFPWRTGHSMFLSQHT